jgi:hypothetical protein
MALGVARAGTAGSDRIVTVRVQGTELRIELASGKVLAGKDLVGATLWLAVPGANTPARVRIDEVIEDPTDLRHEILLYHMSAIDSVTGAAAELCNPDAHGDRWVFPLQGQWTPDGERVSAQGYTLTCADGAQGKCVRFGYKPWVTLANGTSLADYHQACIRLVRAAYCDGHGTTRDGEPIDIYDAIGIQRPDTDPKARDLRFEAGWDPHGAVCVAHTRVPQNVTLAQLAEQCPALAGSIGEHDCTPEIARRSRAIVFNRSR